jgi:hypothetical protein
MLPLLTTTAQIQCMHGGRVQLQPTQTVLTIQGGFVLCVPDLLSMPIVGCPQIGPGLTPCTLVVMTEPPIVPLTEVVLQGRVAYAAAQLGTPGGLTNGVPPAPIVCLSPGQMRQV